MGFDLKQLFIATEGTLGIVTKATVKLCPRPKELELAVLGVPSFKNIPALLSVCASEGETPTAFEFFDAACMERVLEKHPNLNKPFAGDFPYYVLIELEKRGQDSVLELVLEKAFEQGIVEDGVIAGSSKQFTDMWAYRENISESLSSYKYLYKNDIAVPVAKLTTCVEGIEQIFADFHKDLKLYLFGHIGDGNIHLNYGSDSYQEHSEFITDKSAIEKQIFTIIHDLRGTISAEHGVGILKKSQISYVLTEAEMATLRLMKKTFDPKGILNPGKILPS